MNYLFYFGHPAQFLTFRETIKRLSKEDNQVFILIKTKDVLENLVIESGFTYQNLFSKSKDSGRLSKLLFLLRRIIKLSKFVKKNKIDLLIGSDAAIAIVAKIRRRPSITVLEDDYDVVPLLSKITFPFSTHILVPEVTRVQKRYQKKKTTYSGFMKLGYLHPNVFKPNASLIPEENSQSYAIIRISALNAHHDRDIKGISISQLEKIIELLEKFGKVYISSEKVLPERFNNLILNSNPALFHHILANANIVVSDSQSVSVESSILGVPSVRISDFSGRISVLNELEDTYQLTFSVVPSDGEKYIEIINNTLLIQKTELKERTAKLLKDKIDFSAFMFWFLENYPESVKILKENPDYQYNFR